MGLRVRLSRGCGAVAALVALMLAMAPASATVIAPQGGPGGQSFTSECRLKDQYVSGFDVRVGWYMDSIQPMCGQIFANPRNDYRPQFYENIEGATRYGGTGGNMRNARCPGDRYVSAIGFGAVVGQLKVLDGFLVLFCTSIAHPGIKSDECVTSPDKPRTLCNLPWAYGRYRLSCPQGEAVTGIHGRSGVYVDALGIICSPLPKITIPPQSFAGTWTTMTSDIVAYTISFKQAGATAAGTYQSLDGKTSGMINGTVTGSELRYTWLQNGRKGAGKFTLKSDGKSFKGTYSNNDNHDKKDGEWNGVLVPAASVPAPAPVEPPPAEAGAPRSFVGTWSTMTSDIVAYTISLKQAGATASGTYQSPDGKTSGTIDGTVTGNELRYTWQQKGGKGAGKFTLAGNGKSFKGTYSNNDNHDKKDGEWNGVLVATAAPPAAEAGPPPVAAPPAEPTGIIKPPGKIDLVNALLALLTQAVNVRSEPRVPGAKEAPNIVTTLARGAQVRVLDCTGSWCRVEVPGIGTGFVSKKFVAVDGGAAPAAPKGPEAAPQPVPQPAPPPPPQQTAALPSFSGSWSTITDKQVIYTVTLAQTGDTVSGTYVSPDGSTRGTIEGRVAANVLRFVWSQSNGAGAGKFTLSGDGKSFQGTYSNNDSHDHRDGDWSGIRQ